MGYWGGIRPLIITAILFQFFSTFGQKTGENGWKLAKVKDGIKVYTRIPEGVRLKEYKAETIVEATPERVLEVLTDADRYSEWMSGIKETKRLKKEGDSAFYIYALLSLPWPFDDRDEVSRSVVMKDTIPGGYFMPIRLVSGLVPEKKGIVRMTNGKGYWLIEPLPDGKTRIIHQFIGDPGGNIPAWIVNIFLVDSPYKSFLGLRQELMKEPE
ncbi:MAG: START domain-containing protein [Chlorobi bacterium]|nr:START domain-containing protein [Chlorobiota bacterium]